MRIPDGYFSGGFGQVLPQVTPAYRPDTGGSQFVAAQGERLGNTGLEATAHQIAFDGRIDLMNAQETQHNRATVQQAVDAQFAHEQTALNQTAAQKAYLGMDVALSDVQRSITTDESIKPEEYTKVFLERSKQVTDDIESSLTPEQQPYFEPHKDKKIADSLVKLGETVSTKMQQASWANILSSADSMAKDPNKDVFDKIELYQDPSFWKGANKSPVEIEEAKQKFIKQAIDNDLSITFSTLVSQTVDAKGNKTSDTKTTLHNIQNFIGMLEKKTESGEYAYLPEMDPTGQRSHYVDMALMKKQQILSEEERRRRENEAAVRQEATNMVMEFKDKVSKGWIPTSKEDFSFVSQVKRYASSSPSLSRQFGDTYTNMNSMDYRLQLKRKDPLGVTAAENGINLKPINFVDAVTLPQQFAERLSVSNKLGIKAIFTGQEIEALSEYLKSVPPKDQGRLIAAISKPLGSVMSAATFNAAAEQLKIKDPDLAITFKLVAQGKHDVAELYSTGRSYMQGEKKDFLKDKFGQVQQEVTDRLKKDLGDAFSKLPETRNQIKDTIATVYLAETQRRNISLDKLDRDLLTDVTRRVVGNTVNTGSWSSSKVTVIPGSMKPDQFKNSVKAITPLDIDNRGGIAGLDSYHAAKFIRNAAWHESDGGYSFEKDGKPLFGNNGKPFVFRFDKGVGSRPAVAPVVPAAPVEERLNQDER